MGFFDLIGQVLANSDNIQMQEATNRQNRKMFDDQLNFTREMWDKTNEYNTPLAQRRRYEEAGINPYLMLGGLQSGNASASVAPSGNPAVAPRVEPLRFGSAIEDTARNIQDMEYKTEMIQAQREANRQASVDTRYKLVEKRLDLQKKVADTKLTDTQRKSLEKEIGKMDIEIDYLSDFLSARNEHERNEALVSANQARLVQLQGDQQEIVNQYLPLIESAKLSQINAIAADALASAAEHHAGVSLKDKQGQLALAEKVVAEASERGIKLDNQEKESCMKYVIESAKLANQSMRKHIRQQGQDYWNPFRYAGQILGGAAAGSVAAGVKSSGSRAVVRGFVP